MSTLVVGVHHRSPVSKFSKFRPLRSTRKSKVGHLRRADQLGSSSPPSFQSPVAPRSKPAPQLPPSGRNPPLPAIALKLDPGRSVCPDGPTPPPISAVFQLHSVRRCPWCSPVFHDGQKRAFSRVETLQNRKTEGRKSNPGATAAFHGHHGTRPQSVCARSTAVYSPSSATSQDHRRAKKRTVKTELATHPAQPKIRAATIKAADRPQTAARNTQTPRGSGHRLRARTSGHARRSDSWGQNCGR